MVNHGEPWVISHVPIFHITQPLDSIRYMVYNGYYKVMSNIPKMGHLTTPVNHKVFHWFLAEENAGGEIPRVTGDVLKACRPYPVLEYFRNGEEMDPVFHGLVFMGSPNSLGGLFGRFQLLWGETMP